MKICVQGLWHLGPVIAASLASVGHKVVGLDSDAVTIDKLSQGKAPLFEPGLDCLIGQGLAQGNLEFTIDPQEALANARVLWVAFDTPVDENDHADVDFVNTQVKKVLTYLCDGAIVVISSQMPVGSIHKLETFVQQNLPEKKIGFAYSPENLRLGKALDVFIHPDRVVVGVRTESDQRVLHELLRPVTDKIEWMSVESAEMTKHAINAFLATSVTFGNEIAAICEMVGADAKEVERGLKTEVRIGSKAYVAPGGPFSGGTLARDIEFLRDASKSHKLSTPLLSGVRASNDEHKNWFRRKLLQCFSSIAETSIAIWGLTYKPGTDTLRRSLAVELCDWLLTEGAKVRVYDPVVKHIPEYWSDRVVHCTDALQAVKDADALIVGTEWLEFRQIADALAGVGKSGLIVIDANRHLSASAPKFVASGFSYIAVGSPILVGA